MSKFSGFRKFRLGRTLDEVIDFLQSGLALSFSELQTGLQSLNFADNFDSFEVTVTIPAGSEIAIPNKLGAIPTKRIIVRSNSISIIDGTATWTNTFVFIRNVGVTEAKATIIFLR